MISIIVSSYKPNIFEQFEKNVSETIGVEYEIVQVHNPGLMGLCEAYNIGISRAKYDYLCFSHEDIIFHTQGWGKLLVSSFQSDERIGIIGVAGSSYKPWVPSAWSFPKTDERTVNANLLQDRNDKVIKVYFNLYNEKISEVVVVDGCWLCTKKAVVNKYKFDEILFRKYHCYDIDFCLAVAQEYKVAVVYDILLEHMSEGAYDKSWLVETYKLHEKWKNLPCTILDLKPNDFLYQEAGAYVELIKKMKNNQSLDLIKLLKISYSPELRSILGLKNWICFMPYVLCKLIDKAFEKLAYKLRLK